MRCVCAFEDYFGILIIFFINKCAMEYIYIEYFTPHLSMRQTVPYLLLEIF